MSCRAVLSIGGNQAEAAAADGILRAASSVYSTPPWGGVEQDDFLNAVLVVEHPGSPDDVLEWGFERERAASRTREVRWGPRTLDVDVVVAEVDGVVVTSGDPVLTLPHPRAVDRAFVLVPWLEVEPEARLGTASVRDLVGGLDPKDVAEVRRLEHALAPEGWMS